MADSGNPNTEKKAPIGGPGTNQFQVKGFPKTAPTPVVAPVHLTEDLRAGLNFLVRDDEEYELDQEEIPSIRRALTDGSAFEDLVRTGVAYGIMWALGKLLLELFDGDD
jgi:hypothetical protein